MAGSFIEGLPGAIASAFSAATEFAGQERANRQNKDIWRKSQDWAEHMSSTAYQRATADMKKAGINPMLAVSQGGASTPSSSIGAPMQSSTRGATAAVNSAISAQRLKTDIAEANSRIALNQSTAKATDAKAAKDKATQPVYELGGDIAKSGTSSARAVAKYFDPRNKTPAEREQHERIMRFKRSHNL